MYACQNWTEEKKVACPQNVCTKQLKFFPAFYTLSENYLQLGENASRMTFE